jgi:SnoaL-like domain
MFEDRTVISALVQDWVIFRDSGDWERLRAIWAPDGITTTSWFQGSADEFVERSRRAFGAPVPEALHMLGAITVDVAGKRAISQAKMTIAARGSLEGSPCEVTCWGRFYDFWSKDDALGWRLIERAGTYERDRLDILNNAPFPTLDASVLKAFPPGYRHLAYVQQAAGATVNADLPGLTGPAVEALYARGRGWLAGPP